MSDSSPNQPNKPGGELHDDGAARDPGDRQAVENQGKVTPDDYPPGSDGKPPVPTPPD